VNPADKKKLRAEAHSLKPVVMIGQSGLTAAVLAEIELALNSHELIKVKIRAERDERKQICEKICLDTGAETVQAIGQIAVIYRLNPDK
jgi:RNA-binding protein